MSVSDIKRQKYEQKLNKLSPDRRAVVNMSLLNAAEGDEEMRKLIQGMNLETSINAQKASERASEANLKFKKDAFKDEKDELKYANVLGGIGGVSDILTGLNTARQASKRAKLLDSISNGMVIDYK